MTFFRNVVRRVHGAISSEHYRPAHGLELEPYLAREEKQGIHHLARYHWARMVLTDAQPVRVLDIACGAGFGSYLVAQALPATQVTGADYDARAIADATRAYARPNLRFEQGDMVTWTCRNASAGVPLGCYDAIVSFDTLEHLRHREIALMHVVRNLSDEGCFLLSTPCGHEQTVLSPRWEHHEIEYSYRDLQEFLRRFFRIVLIPEDGSLPHLNFWTDVVNRDTVRYLNLTNPVVCRDPIRLA